MTALAERRGGRQDKRRLGVSGSLRAGGYSVFFKFAVLPAPGDFTSALIISLAAWYAMMAGTTIHAPLGMTQKMNSLRGSLWPMLAKPEKASLSQYNTVFPVVNTAPPNKPTNIPAPTRPPTLPSPSLYLHHSPRYTRYTKFSTAFIALCAAFHPSPSSNFLVPYVKSSSVWIA